MRKILILVLSVLMISLAGCTTTSDTGDESSGSIDSRQENNEDESLNNDDSQQEDDEEEERAYMYLYIDDYRLEVELENNSSVDALIEILQESDITYTADDYGNFEKVGALGYSLPRNDTDISTEAGDVILYLGSNICLYYGSNTWSFTRLGKITGMSESEIREALSAGEGEITVRISLN